MKVERIDDPRAFMAQARELLMRSEARHNLALGIIGTLIDRPEVYPDYRLWITRRENEAVHAAFRTPPFPLGVAQPVDPNALEVLAERLVKEDPELPGVVGALPEVDGFAGAWTSLTGGVSVTARREGVYALREVRPVPATPGAFRVATQRDRPLLVEWCSAFSEEAIPDDPQRGMVERSVDARLGGGDVAGLWLWEDGGIPVSMAGFSGPTPNGMRIGPVYTPPAARGRGYATALVAAMSSWLLGRGRSFCFLYTDLANPTSNGIYRRIGYEQVCEAASIRFER